MSDPQRYWINLDTEFTLRVLPVLKGAKLSCYACLALHMDEQNRCTLPLDSIVEETGLERPTVCRALRELAHLHLIVRERPVHGAITYQVQGDVWKGDPITEPVHEPLSILRVARTPRSRRREAGDWRYIRRAILKRDNVTCRYCGAPAQEVDHIVPRCQGGTDADTNLAAACTHCNRKKKGRTPQQAGMDVIS